MGFKVIWTQEAIADLRQAVSYISRMDPDAALKWGEAVLQRSMMLTNHPRLGHVFKKLCSDLIREIPTPPYRLIYEIREAESVILVRVLWHGARREPEIT